MESLLHEAGLSLHDNRIDPKFLYITARQAGLWREVFLKHSPIHGNPEFARIYRDAFTLAIDRIRPGKVLLAGLGCGTGAKELEFHAKLQGAGHEALFAAVDISRELVLESAQKLAGAGASHERSLVCDLAEAEFLGEWLEGLEGRLPRVITFFGLTPNLAPSVVARIFQSVLRPGDILLASAHLAPVAPGDREGLSAAMESVLPQYDNRETMAWLSAALENWGLEKLVEPPEMKIGEIEGIPAFIASSKWKEGVVFEKWGHRYSPKIDEPLQVFSSLRYTPDLFESVMRGEGLIAELLAVTGCGQEAIWAVTGNQGTPE